MYATAVSCGLQWTAAAYWLRMDGINVGGAGVPFELAAACCNLTPLEGRDTKYRPFTTAFGSDS